MRKQEKQGKELVEIGIENGKITAIASSVEGEAKQIIDAKGKLVTESFVKRPSSSVQGIYIGNGRSGRFKGIQ